MKRYLKRVYAVVLILAMTGSALVVQASALEGRISVAAPTATVGETVTVTVSVVVDSGISTLDAELNYDDTRLEFLSGSSGVSGGSGSIRLFYCSEEETTKVDFSLKFKAQEAGDAVIRMTHGEATDREENPVVCGLGSETMTIHACKQDSFPSAQCSSEARLSSLTVSSGSLSPAFSPDVYDYSVTVAADTECLGVSVSTCDGNAQYSISGTELCVGENRITISVVAEDGTEEIYTLSVTRPERKQTLETEPGDRRRAETDRISVTVGEQVLYVSENLNGIELPAGFELRTVLYANREVPAAVGLADSLTLFWLVDESGANGAFYVLDEADSGFYPYRCIATEQKMFVILPLGGGVAAPEGFEEAAITIGEENYPCWKDERNPESVFVLLYARNGDGQTGFYRYDPVEETMQRWLEGDINGMTQNPDANARLDQGTEETIKANEMVFEYGKMMIRLLSAVAAVELVLLIGVIYVLIKRSRKNATVSECPENKAVGDEQDRQD